MNLAPVIEKKRRPGGSWPPGVDMGRDSLKVNLLVRYRGLRNSFFRRATASLSGGWPILLSRKSVRQMLNPTVRIICYSRLGACWFSLTARRHHGESQNQPAGSIARGSHFGWYEGTGGAGGQGEEAAWNAVMDRQPPGERNSIPRCLSGRFPYDAPREESGPGCGRLRSWR